MQKVQFPPVPPEPAHPMVIKLFDDLVTIYRLLREKYQTLIDQAFDQVSRQLGFVVTTTVPIVLEVGEKGVVEHISMGAEHLQGTLFDQELTAALKQLYDDPLPVGISPGTHNLYLLWFEALRLKLRTDWVEPAHVRPGLQVEAARFRPRPWEEPAHWFDPGTIIAAEEGVLISAIDEVYPELRLADRVGYYRRGMGRATRLKEYPKPLEPDTKKRVNKQLVMRALTDPEFRKMLAADPGRVLDIPEFSAINKQEIEFVLATVKAIDYQIATLADELLCANGGPCGIG